MTTRSQWLVAGALLLSLAGIATAQIVQRPLNPGTRKSAGISYWTAASEPVPAADGELAVRSNGIGSQSELVIFDSSVAGGSGSWLSVFGSSSGGTNNTIPVWDATGVLEDSALDDVSGQMIITGTASQLSFPAGTAADPSFIFTDDDDGTGTGIYRGAADEVAITLNGSVRYRFRAGQFIMPNGTANAPSHTFSSGTDLGMFFPGVDNVGFAVGGVLVFDLEDTNAAGAGATLATISSTLGIFNGSDTASAFSIEITNVNHTSTSNTVNLINLAAITGDAESNLNAILIGALTGTAPSSGEEEIALNIGAGWDNAIVIQDGAAIRWEGATADTEEFTLTVSDPTADVTVIHRAGLDSADTYHVLVVPDGELTTSDFLNPLTANTVAFGSASNADDVLLVQRFYLPYPLTVISVDITNTDLANASAGDNTIAVGIYEDADGGAQIVEVIGPTDDTANAVVNAYTMNIADTTFEPGWYRIAFCAQDTTDNDIGSQTLHADVLLVFGGSTGEIVGTAANPCVDGNPPATTGAITGAANVIPFILVSN